MRSSIRLALTSQLLRLNAQYHGAGSLIGWSLVGVFARELARHQPERACHVYTLGSPINGNPEANNMQSLFRWINRNRPVKTDWNAFNKRRQSPPVPCTALYSRQDGIVAWRCCIEDAAPNTENIEVGGSHFGLVFNRQVLKVLTTKLAASPTPTD